MWYQKEIVLQMFIMAISDECKPEGGLGVTLSKGPLALIVRDLYALTIGPTLLTTFKGR